MKNFWDGYPVIRQDLQQIQQIILESVGQGEGELSQVIREYVGRGGKMLRPAFVLLAAYMKEPAGGRLARSGDGSAIGGSSSVGPVPQKIYRIAAAIEMLHMATLIHDDILDDAATRRGHSTLHRNIGPKAAVLIGDLLFSRCFSMVADFATMDSARRLAGSVSHICAGEIKQAQKVSPAALSERFYLHRVAEKTALLFLLSFHVGAHENGVNGSRLQALRRVGYNVGIGFQIIDDLLDFTGSEHDLGKPVAGDLRQGVFTLPVIAALRRNGSELRELLEGDLADETRREQAVTLIREYGGFAYARERAQAYTDRALRAAAKLPAGDVRDAIIDVTSRLLVRSG